MLNPPIPPCLYYCCSGYPLARTIRRNYSRLVVVREVDFFANLSASSFQVRTYGEGHLMLVIVVLSALEVVGDIGEWQGSGLPREAGLKVFRAVISARLIVRENPYMSFGEVITLTNAESVYVTLRIPSNSASPKLPVDGPLDRLLQ